ncbi:MAG TPA: hypothetical protein DER60_09970 [Syntrophomonas sp.]|jgi:hypothetical protein|nr:hypothetical protein [Syntrophomonas sp.]
MEILNNHIKPVGKTHSMPAKSNKRKFVWDISSDLFCSVCGTCLDMDEQRLILNKLHIDCKPFSDHEIHMFMVQALYSENKVSRRLNSHLNHKYRCEISRFGNCTEDQFMAAWQDHVKSGHICGLYWVAVTHPGLAEKTINNVFGDVHMLSHLNGGKARQEKIEYDRLSYINAQLTARLRQEKKDRRELAKDLTASEKIRRNLENKLHNLEKRISADSEHSVQADTTINSCVEDSAQLTRALHQAENAWHEAQERVQKLEKEKEALQSDLWLQKEINVQLCSEIERLIRDNDCDQTDCSQNQCCRHLCDKRVLIVGGLTKLRSFYRDVVENLGADFEYHDGYLHSGERELEGLIKKSDIILCPVDCNSHGACLSVKKICSRINKPYKILSSSSLSSISQALTTVKRDPS